jgi:LysM repeat protein
VADDDFIYHPIDSRKDTLMGLSLKYGVSVSELRLVNNLPTENIGMLRELRIPKGTARVRPTATGVEDSRRSKLRKLQVEHGLSAEEATYYLEASGFDYTGAVAALRDDEAFDAKTGGAATRAAATAAASATHVSAVASAGASTLREARAGSPPTVRDAALSSLLVDSAGAGGASSAVVSRTSAPGSVGGELRRRRGGSDDGGM